MKFHKDSLLNLFAVDLLIISFATFLTFLNLLFFDKVDNWLTHIFYNTIFSIFILLIANIDAKKKNSFWEQIHYWYVLPTIFFSFKEIYFMVKPIAGFDCDQCLIAIDKFVFGVNPTQFLYQFSNPLLTEILQIAYSIFFFLPIILVFELQLRKNIINFKFVIFSITLGFILSYIGYFLVPAVGPRFTLHEFEMTNIELPGLWLTNYLREIINSAESVPAGTINPINFVQRDVFPSGHTQMTLIVMYLSYKLKIKSRYFVYFSGILLIFATVYLRYHYVVDVIAGVAFMILTMYLAKLLFNWWNTIRRKDIFEY
ncbi:MAG: phosphatase PAP2 family protein [Bacteroidetes bacterium]|nr:phosphatase PAP2 family protein [Bacteroidota bacterium]